LTEGEYQDVLEKIKKFQPPSLDIKKFTLEKQNEYAQQASEVEGEEYGVMEVIEEDSAGDEETMEQADLDYYEECQIYNEDL
jgi:hypothetical protein